ncbi:ABC transporter substrate-binding protein [Pricia sp. S334]|uniref:ABC transporter substrate-binding protein n=1 Tax=Pricia mediterranea TaxID=3076079 RepID=A0ABU3LB13_9FLAO|nr:ABC transporter substrate-binding protein [Pricia sp. S334]MDT7830277.1 ABC transporter substrate-binding protein [Pricia sp. S334]
MKTILSLVLLVCFISCGENRPQTLPPASATKTTKITNAQGFSVEKSESGLTVIEVASPWPGAEKEFTYALVPKEKMAAMTLNRDAYDAIVSVPVERIVVTSTTHIPALEALDVGDKLVGFPGTEYISTKATRKRINAGQVKELGKNETINTEMVLEMNPDAVIGFGVDGQNKAYATLKKANIPIVYNGDWTEESPLGKAEWIKFFAPFFDKEAEADSIFERIESSYLKAKKLAQTASEKPSVLSGALYKDVWYLPGGKSWAAQFFNDAHADYLWKNTPETGSISLSFESVLEKGKAAEFWIAPAQFVSYPEMEAANPHYLQFDAFKNRKIYTFADTKGETGGILYYELAPQRPDLVLQDLIHIFHPELLPEHNPFFFKPLD